MLWRILSSFPAWSDRNRDFGIEYISFWMIWSANFEIIRWWEVDLFRGRNLVEFSALEPVHSSETWAGTKYPLTILLIALLWTLYRVSFVSTMLAWGNIPVFPVFGSLWTVIFVDFPKMKWICVDDEPVRVRWICSDLARSKIRGIMTGINIWGSNLSR